MRHVRRSVWWLATVAALVAVPALAAHADEGDEGYFTAGRFGVGLRTTTIGVASKNTPDQSTQLDGGGLHIRYRFAHHWSIELASEHLHYNNDASTYVRDSKPVTLTVMWHLSHSHRWDWYLLFGLGETQDDVTFQKVDGTLGDQKFAESHVQLGTGLERRWSHLGIGAELRAVGFTREKDKKDAPLYGEKQDGPIAAESSGMQFNLTGTWYF